METQRLNDMTSGQTAECFYLKCDECNIASCSCFCHVRRSNFYDRLDQKRLIEKIKPDYETDSLNRSRGRPPRLIAEIKEMEKELNKDENV
jgi:hypothetical protein